MKLWFADSALFENAYLFGARRSLVSYAYIAPGNVGDRWIKGHPRDAEIFLDSGAFGVMTGRVIISLPEYCYYIRANAGALVAYAALDVIGDVGASWENYEKMCRLGLDPVQTWHIGEPLEDLDRITAAAAVGQKLMAIGGMAGRATSQTLGGLQRVLDGAWARIGKHWPVRVHAFGVTAAEVMLRYPFYSADSISHALTAGMGRVMTFDGGEISTRHWVDYARLFMTMGVAGSDWRSSRDERWRVNIGVLLEMERFITDTWAARGISWPEVSQSAAVVKGFECE